MQPAWASLRLLGRLRGEEDSEDAVEALIQTASSMPPQWPFLGLVRFSLLFLFGCFFGVVGWFVHTYPYLSKLSKLNPSKS